MGEALSVNNTTGENGQTGRLIGKTKNLVVVPPNGDAPHGAGEDY